MIPAVIEHHPDAEAIWAAFQPLMGLQPGGFHASALRAFAAGWDTAKGREPRWSAEKGQH